MTVIRLGSSFRRCNRYVPICCILSCVPLGLRLGSSGELGRDRRRLIKVLLLVTDILATACFILVVIAAVIRHILLVTVGLTVIIKLPRLSFRVRTPVTVRGITPSVAFCYFVRTVVAWFAV